MRFAVLSDVHGNLDALEVVLNDAETEMRVDGFWFLGDAANYGPQTNECVQKLHGLTTVRVAGNHDRVWVDDTELGKFADDVSKVFSLSRIDPASLDCLRTWPVEPQHPETAPDFTLVHGSPRDFLWEYVHSWVIAKLCFSRLQTRYCLVGHTHRVKVFELDATIGGDGCRVWTPEEMQLDVWHEPGMKRLIINPGSVGQPRDEDPRAAYLIVDTERPAILFRRVTYPIERTQRKMEEAGLPAWLITRLQHGW